VQFRRTFFRSLLNGFRGGREQAFHPDPCGMPSDATCVFRLFEIRGELLICGYPFAFQELHNRRALSFQCFERRK